MNRLLQRAGRWIQQPFAHKKRSIRAKWIQLYFSVFPKSRVLTNTRYGRMFLQDDYIGRSIFIGSRDEIKLDFLETFLPEHACIGDIGANIGYNTIFFATRCAANVFAFEPSSKEFEILRKNVAMNKLESKCTLEQLIVSNSQAERTLHLSDINFGTNTLYPSNNNSYSSHITVKSTSIDSYSMAKNVKFDFLKIDVEGAELEVLEGALHTLSVNRPHLFIEIWGHYNKVYEAAKDPVTQFLSSQSYSLFTITANRKLRKVNEHDFVQEMDFLAIHQSRVHEISSFMESL